MSRQGGSRGGLLIFAVIVSLAWLTLLLTSACVQYTKVDVGVTVPKDPEAVPPDTARLDTATVAPDSLQPPVEAVASGGFWNWRTLTMALASVVFATLHLGG